MSDARQSSGRPVFTIRMGLLLSFALVVTVTSGGILVASYLGTHRLVQGVSRSLLDSSTQEVEQRLRNLFNPVEWAILEKRTAIELGSFSAGVEADRAELIPSLASLPHVGSVMVGDENGYQLLVMRYDETAYNSPIMNAREAGLAPPVQGRHRFFTREFRADAWGNRARWSLLDADFKKAERVWETQIPDYDPRRRPWYLAALANIPGLSLSSQREAAERPVAWTKVYTMLTTQGPGISASVATFDPEGHLKVVAYDLLLDAIARITTQYSASTPKGLLYILDSNNQVIGPPRGSPAGAKNLSGDAAELNKYWRTVLEGREGVFRCSLPSGDWWVGFHPFHLGSTETFWICVSIPEADLVPQARDSRLLIGGAAMAALILAAYLAVRMSRAFACPIGALAEQGRRIAALDLEAQGPERTEFKELDALAHTLDDMRDALAGHITQLEKARLELSERERQVRTLIESPIGGILVCRGNEVRFANKTAAAYLGYENPEETRGVDMLQHVAIEDREDISRRLDDTLSGGLQHPHPGWRLIRKDGSQAWMQSVLTRIDWEGSPSAQVFLRDITELRTAGERQAVLQEQLRQAQKLEAIGLLAGGVAHDLNNLLQVVGGNAALARDEGFPDADRKIFLLEIEKAVGNATQMIRQLLAFSRRQTLQRTVVELNSLIRGNLELSKRLFPVDIRFDFKPAASQVLVHGDQSQLDQVLLNLCLNARDAQPQGGLIEITVEKLPLDEETARRLCGHGAGEYARLCVRDSGCGMPREVLDHVFEPFFTTKPKGKGTGLGLAVVYGIVKQHQGGIQVKSEPGKGTCFEVCIPLYSGGLRSASSGGDSEIQASFTGTVLVAEDNDQVRLMCSMALRNAGFTVLEARDGVDALDVFSKQKDRIDVLFFDVVMPQMNGFETARRCREVAPGIPILFASGFISEEAGDASKPPPNTHILNKPYKIDELLAELQKLLPQ